MTYDSTAQLQQDDQQTTARTGMNNDDDNKTRADAGRLGGIRTKARYGDTDFYAKIGRKGGLKRGKNR